MLSASVIIIRPGDSPSYVRLVLGLHFLWALLIAKVGISWYMQLILLIFLSLNCVLHWSKSPCSGILELRLSANQCLLVMKNGQMLYYEKLTLPIYNSLFGLIQLKGLHQNAVFVLFNDQLHFDQLRWMHVKAWSH